MLGPEVGLASQHVRPLAVLVNAYTASASEITAGAIEDSGTGTLIGTKTFGKGVVQTIFPLRDGSAVKITTARYFTPNGHDINTIGIQPQIEAEIPADIDIDSTDAPPPPPKNGPDLILQKGEQVVTAFALAT